MSKCVLELTFKRTREGTIEEDEGMEKTTYPNLGTWLQERLVDEVKTSVLIGSKAGKKLTLRIEKGRW